MVAPFAGAWIEILGVRRLGADSSVAPFAGAWIEILGVRRLGADSSVAPFAGAWIEISLLRRLRARSRVAPFAGAWIEMKNSALTGCSSMSLPSRERRLKCQACPHRSAAPHVAPFTGAWIEIVRLSGRLTVLSVAPFTGAWIEMSAPTRSRPMRRSPPSRERGLKYLIGYLIPYSRIVAPFAGVWIEICKGLLYRQSSEVAPFTGAWIEMRRRARWRILLRSLPSRERGLKSAKA